MKTTILISLFIGSWLWLTTEAWAVKPLPDEIAQSKSWVASVLGEAAAKEGRLPFSFVYDGRPATELLKGWTFQRSVKSLDPSRTEHTLAWTDPKTALAVRCVAVEYLDLPAVEWTLYFKNGGAADTPILENVLPLDASLDAAGDGECRLDYAEGSHERITDFRPMTKVLSANDRISLASFGGRSSDGFLPFFNLALPGSGGVITAIGWTGQWAAEFARGSDATVRIRAGMEITHLRLDPGEEIRTPAMLLMFWAGNDRVRSQNLFRSLLLRHYTPTPGGHPVDPPIAFSPHAEIAFEGTTETNTVEVIERITKQKLPVDYWWIDAGWYDCQKNWARWVGTWDVDPKRFPRGLKPMVDTAHQKGLKFVLWFEPERVMKDTWLAKNHADWLLPPPPAKGLPTELQYMANDGFHLLDFGNSEALAWARKTFGGMVSELKIDAYRNDFNMYPLYYWRNQEEPDRQGMREIKYVMGLYDYFDTLTREHPGLLLDTCASGGRRIDFEMLRRCLVLTRSDYLWDPVGQQCHTFGLSQWIPLTGIGAASTGPYECRSGMGSHFALAINTATTDAAGWTSVNGFLERYRSIRHLFQGDFYPLSPYSTEQKPWLAFQFDRPDLGEGVVQVFRRAECAEETWTGRLHGLDPQGSYRITDWDSSQPKTLTGRELQEKGLTVCVTSKPGAGVLVYKKMD